MQFSRFIGTEALIGILMIFAAIEVKSQEAPAVISL